MNPFLAAFHANIPHQNGIMCDPISELDRLRFYRDEVKHEFSMLTPRLTILVTCQSFLVVPFAILNTAPRFRSVTVAVLLVALLGLTTALILVEPLRAGHRALEAWLKKQRQLIQSTPNLKVVAIDRDLIPGVPSDSKLDLDHHHSFAFSKYGPLIFSLFWLAALVFSIWRAATGL